jgi:hypothetical protein
VISVDTTPNDPDSPALSSVSPTPNLSPISPVSSFAFSFAPNA